MRRVYSFSELSDSSKNIARSRVHEEFERLPWQTQVISKMLPDVSEAGILFEAQDVHIARDGFVSFSAREVKLDIVLAHSGIGKKYLNHPGYFELFVANVQTAIKRLRPFSEESRVFYVSVSVCPFENNDGGKALLACEIAAGLLEQYLRYLVVTVSDRLRQAIDEVRARIFSASFVDAYLEGQGKIFLKNGNTAMPSISTGGKA